MREVGPLGHVGHVDTLVREALGSFAAEVFVTGWEGREREAVSYFAFGHLAPLAGKRPFLRHPTQVGIEVAVPQIVVRPSQKRAVCKDLVLWPEPRMTLWRNGRAENIPAAILEWKVQRERRTVQVEQDHRWLESFTRTFGDVVGYAVLLRLEPGAKALRCARFHRGEHERDWLRWPERR